VRLTDRLAEGEFLYPAVSSKKQWKIRQSMNIDPLFSKGVTEKNICRDKQDGLTVCEVWSKFTLGLRCFKKFVDNDDRLNAITKAQFGAFFAPRANNNLNFA
jgi:hypothetical protein